MKARMFFEDYQKWKPLKPIYWFLMSSNLYLQVSNLSNDCSIFWKAHIIYTLPFWIFQFWIPYYEHVHLSPIRLVVECHFLIHPPAGRLLVKLLVAWKEIHFNEEFSSCAGRCPKYQLQKLKMNNGTHLSKLKHEQYNQVEKRKREM